MELSIPYIARGVVVRREMRIKTTPVKVVLVVLVNLWEFDPMSRYLELHVKKDKSENRTMTRGLVFRKVRRRTDKINAS
jgi:hypothetical protein